MIKYSFWVSLAVCVIHFTNVAAEPKDEWRIDTTAEWKASCLKSENLEFKDDMAVPSAESGTYQSVIKTFKTKRKAKKLVLGQSPIWQNWEPTENLGPSNLADAPVLLVKGPGDYWMFGRYGKGNRNRRAKKGKPKAEVKAQPKTPFKAETATLEGFDVPLMTTQFPHQYNAPGGLKPSLGGYHAWQSRDMVNWVHHGPVTKSVSKWVTTAEQVDGKTYIYYDYPNDQDPHLYIDDDLTDGVPGKNMGLAFKDPSHGSDCSFIRDLNGNFHVIYEDWSPINARKHSWDSPLAGHAVSKDGQKDFKILPPAVDKRTKPTGKKATYNHPHWVKEDPKRFKTNVAEYEVHEPEQDAFGDWAAICIGGQYYLFCDYHPAGQKIRVAWFTSSSLDKQFTFCGELGLGHPDPDIAFAEGKFYLATQTKTDYVSTGPWVESVEARVGVDTTQDGNVDTWTDWQAVSETYDYVKGFSKQVKRIPAELDLKTLPAGYGIGFELRIKDTTKNASKPMLDRAVITFQ